MDILPIRWPVGPSLSILLDAVGSFRSLGERGAGIHPCTTLFHLEYRAQSTEFPWDVSTNSYRLLAI